MKKSKVAFTKLLHKTITIPLLSGLSYLPVASAEFNIALYSGQAYVDDGDLNLKQGNTNLNFNNVSWGDRSFDSPAYYGARVGYWFDSAPNWGVSVDYSHLKNYLNVDKNVQVTGVRDGVAVNGVERVSNTIQDFNESHGVNTVTFNGHYRWFPTGQRDQSLLGRAQLYTGLGAGFSVPHVEALINGARTFEYQAGAGAVINGLLGVNYDIYSFISGFAEYKLTYVNNEDDLKGGGTISKETVNHQLIFGLAAHF
ncbi:MAG: hypothetical protein WC782_03310 [Methylococcaceae bacterium]|jgi:lipid A oxidase